MSLLKLPQALAIALLLAAATLRAGAGGFTLEVQMANPAGGSAAVFYDIGQWYSQRDSVRVRIPPGFALKPYRFALPAEPIHRLRFDLTDRAGTVLIGRVRLLTAEGRILDSFGPQCVRPMSHIESEQIRDGVATIRAGPDNPMVLIDREEQPVTERALGQHFIGAGTLLFFSALVFGAILFSLLAAIRSLPGAGWVFAGVFLVVWGCRLYWLKLYSRPMPFWDEWEMDGRDLLMPLRGHFLDWQALFLPQSEHRSLVSRLAALAASILNGEWDPRVEMVLGAAMYAASVALPCAAAAFTRMRGWFAGVVVMAAIGACPFDSHNLFCGDQCQIYALNLLAMIVLILAVVPPSRVVVVAFAAASAVSLFTMASGCVAPLLGAVAALCLRTSRWSALSQRAIPGATPKRVGTTRSTFRVDATATQQLIIAGVGLAAFACGAALYREAPFQGPEYARTPAVFFHAMIERLSWPLRPHAFTPLLVWLPWLAFLAAVAVRKGRTGFDLFLAALGLWLLANAAGLAHGRPFDHWPFNNKYYTAMLLVVPLSVFAILRLRPVLLALAAAAVAVPLIVASWSLLAQSRAFSAAYWNQQAGYEDAVRPFLRTDDRARLTATSFERLPYWNGAELAAQLDSPLMQPWLPAVLRQCLAARPGSPYPAHIAVGPLTALSRALMKGGLVFAVAGCLALLLGLRPNRPATLQEP